MIKIYTTIIACTFFGGSVNAGTVKDDIHSLQKEWAVINYEVAEDEREAAFSVLAKKANEVVGQYPNRAEPLVWEGIILSTYAGAQGGLGALGLIKEARDRLLDAEKINPNALNGSIYTSLGSLYYQAPGWPISFGSNDDAEMYLKRALEINPNGIDPNFFYGDFLIEQKKYKEAITVLRHALEAQPRPSRSVADAGRKVEINEKISLAKEKIKHP
ncbi:MAG: tetratricopeptide repeat protein [Candidatus Ruthia sp.]|jgi:tetratricopeptide (TPR) repeat protein|nr:tetratricopeptide repeat protein [Candidatus Ruthturnera sp.]